MKLKMVLLQTLEILIKSCAQGKSAVSLSSPFIVTMKLQLITIIYLIFISSNNYNYSIYVADLISIKLPLLGYEASF